MQLRKSIYLFAIALLIGGLTAVSAAALDDDKSPDPVSGKYEGVAKSQSIGELPITVQLKNDGGKITGSIETPQGPAPITSGTYADGKLTMKFEAGGNEGTVTAKYMDGKIVGEWELSGQTGTIELKQLPAMVAAEPAAGVEKKEEASPASPGDPVSGDWDASADVQGTAFPFTIKMKLEGEAVTGQTDSAQGSLPLSKGTFSVDKLSFTLDSPNGPIVFTAIVKDGKITGDFDFAGQMQGKWEAKKK
jgi:hypothetical protein